jgi:hypothetical protein
MTFRVLPGDSDTGSNFDWQALLHPGRAFAHPTDVARDRDLTLNEKRALLAAWASDACAAASAPQLRTGPFGSAATYDEIMEALRLLDAKASNLPRPQPHYRQVLTQKRGEPRLARARLKPVMAMRSNYASGLPKMPEPEPPAAA